MTPLLLPFPALLAEGAVLRWRNLPPAWVVALVVVPLAAAAVVLAYRSEGISRGKRILLGALRLATVLAAILLLFGPFLERTVTKRLRSHLVVLVDTSASMDLADEVDPSAAGPLSEATGIPETELARTNRLDLARRALTHGGEASPLRSMTDRFVTHLYSFSSEPRSLWSGDEHRLLAEEGGGNDGAAAALAALKADGPSTRIGDAVVAALEDFRLREEKLAGLVILSDGRQTSGSRTPREAGEHAQAFLQKNPFGERGVEVLAVLAGDPSSSRNVQVRNLVAPEVVLARDDAAFEFDVVQKGYDNETGTLRLRFLEPVQENALLVPGEVVLVPGETGRRVKARYRFDRPGNYVVRVGVPPLPGERVVRDNWIDHHIRVVDRKVKVLYVDGRPRREWESLERALTRDSETMLVHTLQLESARDVPQPKTEAPGWPSLPGNRFPATRQELFEYDVVILGDADWTRLADTEEEARERLQDLRDFVESGGGLLCIAGEFYMPLEYRRTALADLLPVVVDAGEVLRPEGLGSDASFNLSLTPEGKDSPLLRLDDDPDRSRALWETMGRWRQWWYFPPLRAATGARVLAVHPRGQEEARRGEIGPHSNRFGPHVLVAVKTFGYGRTLWIGVEELWRMRYGVGDQFYYGFYAKAIRYLAAYRLLGGNRRVKLHSERQIYFLDEPVTIVAHVVGEDYRPPTPAEKPSVKVVLTLPDRTEQVLELAPVPQPDGENPLGVYRGTFTASVEGTYTVAPDPSEVPGEDPEEKQFQVQASAEERKDPSVDMESLRALANAAGGTAVPLPGLAAAVRDLKPREFEVPVEARPDPVSDQWWVPVILTLMLAAEWILRKRWRLL